MNLIPELLRVFDIIGNFEKQRGVYQLAYKSCYKEIYASLYYTLINWVGGQSRNILPAAFSVLADRREVSAEKAKGNIFLHWPTNSVNNSFIALLKSPNNFIEKIDPTLQKLTGWIFMWTHWSLDIKFYLSWVIKLKYSIEIDVYSFQTMVNKILNELFYPFRAQQN